MSRDTQPKMSKKEKSKKREEEAKKKKKNQESSDDSESIYTDDDDQELDIHEYRKFLKKIFPSRHLDSVRDNDEIQVQIHNFVSL